MKNLDVISVGLMTIDYLKVLDGLPVSGSTNIPIESHEILGGTAGRAAIAAHRSGAKTIFMGMLGEGTHAASLKALADSEGLTYSFEVDPSSKSSQHSFVIIEQSTGERTIVWNAQPSTMQGLLDSLRAKISEAKVLLIDSTDGSLTEAALKMAREYDVTTVLDTGSYREHFEKYANLVDHIIAPQKFFRQRNSKQNNLHEHMLALSSTFTPKSVVCTEGSEGGCYVNEGEILRYKAFKVDAVDTSGAGDTFHGAFSAKIAAGESVLSACDFASWAAAEKCLKIGNTSIPWSHDKK